MRRFLRHLVAAAGLLLAFTSYGSAAEMQHRLVIQVDQNDRQTMDFALTNATDVVAYYQSVGQTVVVEIMACGPGLHMLREDTSPVKERIKHLSKIPPPSKIQFSACNNTKESMEKKEGRPLELLPGTTVVPLGMVRLMELQEQGWSYVRP
jgi:intracellular sulfur oxidation DsrE/DsrF family protein